jgi:phage repressor protein C with HTH and peptisase S24 domain
MFPTLNDGDDIMVDRSAASRQVNDGIYVLRRDDTLMVKRITVNPSHGTFNVSSDNAAYASWPDCSPGDIDVLGRVVWAGRRIR